MKVTIELPDDLMKQIRLHAVAKDNQLADAVAELLRKGLAAQGKRRALAGPAKAALSRRRQMTRKFVSGEWGCDW
jgi:hypothetical protein